MVRSMWASPIKTGIRLPLRYYKKKIVISFLTIVDSDDYLKAALFS